MAKPATDARMAAAARGFTQVIGRGNASLITKDPSTGKCCFDAQIGVGWHYGDGQETDTAWEADTDQNYLKMVKAGYNLRARKLFNAGDLVQYIDPASGKYVKFQPQNFQWIDGTTGSNSLISVAQAISSPTIDDDKLYWPAAFGTGRHFRYTASPTRLIKHLIIDSAANLPACPAYITNPWLELTFTLTPSSGVIMYVDGQAWNQATAKTTANEIEFRLPSGEVVWSMAAPMAYDSSPEGVPCAGQIKLYVNKKIKYAAVRFPKSWIDSAVFPIVLDPTVEYQVSAQADDGIWYWTGSAWFYANNGTGLYFGSNSSGYHLYAFARWPMVIIPDGATIDSAAILMYSAGNAGTMDGSKIYLEDAANPAAISSASDGNGRSVTDAYVAVAQYASGWYDHDIKAAVEELMAANSYASPGAAMQMIVKWGAETANNYQNVRSRDYSGNTSGPKLHIEYTEAGGGGNPFYAYAQQQ